jgi:hypothetical protein
MAKARALSRLCDHVQTTPHQLRHCQTLDWASSGCRICIGLTFACKPSLTAGAGDANLKSIDSTLPSQPRGQAT